MYEFGPDHLAKISDGISMFNREHFWECHEELEDWWMEDRADHARNVYWAVIQVATANYHFDRKNIEGVKGQWKKALEKITLCEHHKVESELMKKNLSWSAFKSTVRACVPGETLEDFEAMRMFKFSVFDFDRFKTPSKEDL